MLTKARLAQTLFLALFFGATYAFTRNDPVYRAQNIMGAVFFAVVNQSILGLFGVIQVPRHRLFFC